MNNSNVTPLNSSIEPVNNPQPQVVCGVLNNTGIPKIPFYINSFLPLDSVLNPSKPYCMNRFNLVTSDTLSTLKFNSKYPVHFTAKITDAVRKYNPEIISWVDFYTSCHMYYESNIQITMVAIAPEPCVGKLSFLYHQTQSGFDYTIPYGFGDSKLRYPQVEWDLNKTKIFSQTIPNWKSGNRRPTYDKYITRTSDSGTAGYNWLRTGFMYRDRAMGDVKVTTLHPYQVGLIYPSTANVLVFVSYPGLIVSNPIHPGRVVDDFVPSNIYYNSSSGQLT